MPDDLAQIIRNFDWAALTYVIAAVIAGAVLIWAKNAVMRRIRYVRFLADKHLAVDTVIHRPTAVGSEPGVIVDIDPARVTVALEGGRKWLVPPSVLLEQGAVVGGAFPPWWQQIQKFEGEYDQSNRST